MRAPTQTTRQKTSLNVWVKLLHYSEKVEQRLRNEWVVRKRNSKMHLNCWKCIWKWYYTVQYCKYITVDYESVLYSFYLSLRLLKVVPYLSLLILSGQQTRRFCLFERHSTNSEVIQLAQLQLQNCGTICHCTSGRLLHIQFICWPSTQCETLTVIYIYCLFKQMYRSKLESNFLVVCHFCLVLLYTKQNNIMFM